jgi:antirestriction protein ArdC
VKAREDTGRKVESPSERIVLAFEAGIAPWSRSSRLRLTCGLPVDAWTGDRFRGVNTWLLELSSIERSYRNRYWATRRQWMDLGGIVQGEGTPIIEDGDVSRERVVYNLEQVEVGREAPVAILDRFRVAVMTNSDYVMAERVLRASGARVVPDEFCRCVIYRDEALDFIGMPPLSFFGGDRDRYWSVMFHELIHWVVLRSRKDCWNRDPSPGELVAEIGAAILTTRCGIPMSGNLGRNANHVEDWIKGIRFHHSYLSHASKVADLAAEYLLSLAGYES